MKRVFILCAGLLVAGAAMATVPPKVNAGVNAAFAREFKNVTNLNWVRVGEFNEAIFDWNGVKSQAFFSEDGSLVAFAQNVDLTALPEKAINTVKAKYSKYTITEVSKIEHANEGTRYYVALENDSKKIILESDNSGCVTVFKKSNK